MSKSSTHTVTTVAESDQTRIVTADNPLIINAAIADYGAVEIAGGYIQAAVPVTLAQFTNLSKTS